VSSLLTVIDVRLHRRYPQVLAEILHSCFLQLGLRHRSAVVRPLVRLLPNFFHVSRRLFSRLTRSLKSVVRTSATRRARPDAIVGDRLSQQTAASERGLEVPPRPEYRATTPPLWLAQLPPVTGADVTATRSNRMTRLVTSPHARAGSRVRRRVASRRHGV